MSNRDENEALLPPDTMVDHFVIPNISPEVITAMNCGIEAPQGAAVGVIETFSAAASIESSSLTLH